MFSANWNLFFLSLSVYENLVLFFPVSIMKIHECIGLSESAGTESDGRRSETFLLRTSVACTQSRVQNQLDEMWMWARVNPPPPDPILFLFLFLITI